MMVEDQTVQLEGSSYRSPDWLKMKNPACAAVKRKANDSRGMSMGDTLRSIMTRLVAYVAVVIAAHQHRYRRLDRREGGGGQGRAFVTQPEQQPKREPAA
jgi:hypothetical protein